MKKGLRILLITLIVFVIILVLIYLIIFVLAKQKKIFINKWFVNERNSIIGVDVSSYQADIDMNKSKENYHIIHAPQYTYSRKIKELIKEYGCKTRKDSVKLVETLITASPEFMNRLSKGEQREYFERAVKFMKDEIGEDRIISAVVHMDEATPHMHLVFCPINKDGKLSAKSILGNQKSLSEWQTRYYNYMHERWNELERGKSAQETKRKHIPTWLFKLADNLDNLYNQLLKKIENINMIGMKKNKEEAIDLLSEFVPKAEKFSVKVNSYNDYINELEERVLIQRNNNRELAEANLDLKEKIENKDLEVSERIRLMQNQVKKYERLIKKVPEDIIEKIQREEQNRKNRER